MKKFLTLLCMITCILGLTACGSEEQLTTYEAQKVDYAKQLSAQSIVPMLEALSDEALQESLSIYTLEEVEYVFKNQYGIAVEGAAVNPALDSFASGLEEIGAITEVGEATAEIDGKEIIVRVQVTGEKKNAEAEVILSNDMFTVLKSAALNPISSMGELMGKAAMNTLLGMGTVFAVLLLIICVISLFSLIPKIQDKLAKKDNVDSTGIDKAVAQIVVQEENTVDDTDDLELVAVIAAAIAASEGAASTEGFVVRSIRKINRNR